MLTALLLPAIVLSGNGSVVRSPLTSSGADDDARGSILSTLQTKSSLFAVQLEHMTP